MSKAKATGTKAAHTRSRLSTEKKAVVQLVAKVNQRLEEADGLWRYWTSRDITENEDDWVAFTDAVYAHLEGKPVDPRFIVKSRVKS